MKSPLAATALLLSAITASAQQVDVGTGVSETVRQDFLRAYFRNNFSNLTAQPPLDNVKKFGSNGYFQEFQDAARTQNVRYVLVRSTLAESSPPQGSENTFQVYPSIYTLYTSLGTSTIGYPTNDSSSCPIANVSSACTYQLFDKNFGLFFYTPAIANGNSFTVKDPFFSRWRELGGINSLGPGTSAEETVTSGAGTGITATRQGFALGALFNFTSGALTGRLATVREPVLATYLANGGHAGFLGFPTADEVRLSDDRRRQTFEGGAIEYAPGRTPELRLPVSSVVIETSAGSERLNLGDTVTLKATTFSSAGGRLEGRAISWTTSNGRVIRIESSGATAIARAVGGGTATITATSEGKSSRPLTYFVVAPCCQIGEGAPTAAVEQTFIDAVNRSRLSVKLPTSSPVRRVGAGFVQEFQPADGSVARYLFAKGDTSPAAYLVTGALLARYLELGGPAGALGYPRADASPRGRQVFDGGALAGDPLQLVAGAILARWSAQGFESGPAGFPVAPAAAVLTFQATLGATQTFQNGVYGAHSTGGFAGRTFLVTGPMAATYAKLGFASGAFGLPTSDEYGVSGRRRQDFEGGVFEYTPGDTEARAEERARSPKIAATPSTVSAGGRVRIAAGGFPSGATLRISIGGEPDFTVETTTGAYAWEAFVPAGAPSRLVTLRAADVNGASLAVGSYLIQSAAETLARITKLAGDLQIGLPGARLPVALRLVVRDENGSPLSGIPVRFNASPGAAVEEASEVTDGRGEAIAWLRLPTSEVPALATASAGGQVVTFTARAQGNSLQNFPRFSQGGSNAATVLGNEGVTIGDKGALLVSAAAIVRYLQDTGQASTSLGRADPLILNSFLKDFCVFDSRGEKICDGFAGPISQPASEKNVNLWRLASFLGGGLEVVPVALRLESVRDVIGQGSPVLVALALSSEGKPLGSHFVPAMGVSANGAIRIADPTPAFAREHLDDYLVGFTAAGSSIKGTISAVIQLAPRAPSSAGFVVASSVADLAVSSASGPCGVSLAWPVVAATPAARPVSEGLAVYRYCDGQQGPYQLDAAGSGTPSIVVTDLGNPGGRFVLTPSLPAAFRVARGESAWSVTEQQASFSSTAVVNAASFRPELAPGSLATVFGSGLAISGRSTSIEIAGQAAEVLLATPFQVNFAIPAGVPPGRQPIRVASPFGAAEQIVDIQPVAPAVFAFPDGNAAALNQDGSINSPSRPVRRGQVLVVFGTGLGALVRQGNFEVAENPVQGFIEGQALRTEYAGAAPGFPGLNQVNLRIPEGLAPGLNLRLVVRQGSAESAPVRVSVQ